MPETTGLHPEGWYTDPTSSDRQRWWDGTGWTEQYREPEVSPQSPAIPRPQTSYDPFEDWHANNRGGATLTPTALRSSAVRTTTVTSLSGVDGRTPAVWILAITPLIYGVVQVIILLTTDWDSTTHVGYFSGASLGASAAIVSMDRAELKRRGLPTASLAWFLIPLIYFLRRAAVLKKVGIKANAPGNVFVLSAVGAAIIVAVVALSSTGGNAAVVHSFESRVASQLTAKLGSTWTVDCPDDAPITKSGTTFTCDARNATGEGARVDILVDGNSYRITNATELPAQN